MLITYDAFCRHLATGERAHLWTPDNVLSVISFAMDCQQNPVLVGALSVLNCLVEHNSVDIFSLNDASAPVLKLCETHCYKTELEVASGAIQLLCSLAANCKKDMHNVEGNFDNC